MFNLYCDFYYGCFANIVVHTSRMTTLTCLSCGTYDKLTHTSFLKDAERTHKCRALIKKNYRLIDIITVIFVSIIKSVAFLKFNVPKGFICYVYILADDPE